MINDDLVDKLSKLDFVWAIQKYKKIEDFLVCEAKKEDIKLSEKEIKKSVEFIKKYIKFKNCHQCGKKHLVGN